MNTLTHEEIEKIITTEYKNSLSKYKNFCIVLKEQLSTLTSKENIKLALPIEHRVKTLESILEKIERNKLEINALNEINDLAGIRIITLFRSDMEKIKNSIEREFTVHRCEDTSERLQDNQFGYESIHLEISMPNEWCIALSLREFKELKIEIQIRTLSQHNWAVMSHLLQYKQEKDVPTPLKRSINRVAALLETVDNEFERLLQEREDYKRSINSYSNDHNSNEILNVENLKIVLDNNLPLENKIDGETYSSLLRELNYFEISTIKELLDLIENHKENALINDKENVMKSLKNKDLNEFARKRVESGVYFAHTGLLRQMLKSKFGNDKVAQIIKKFQQEEKENLE
ncbi:GTP pyrophosphokinase [Bacillus toyonensis]|uniref:GTP pyrophosphokinase n=1 Tax=Bacillus toyonensis TaxID=155322 RepID=UPI000BF1EEB3|nr:hypothetical protein [Bacillus toyonensis]PEJ91427.1 hypothetical protein CN687_19965 [Bacillus toyonensis]PGC99079.1 hypothetical protein COM26_05980 [Bacillus toyonensis]PGD74319.1 hypothetical protein COM36_28770 [Bacillus toyonensis]PGE84625.1 hypothetical protein COM75_29860 [Bacillus toyonensis]